jgi:hypothetical protein
MTRRRKSTWRKVQRPDLKKDKRVFWMISDALPSKKKHGYRYQAEDMHTMAY